jgi:aminoglycoside phosphotransferase (APT) family kinase protein
MAMFNQIDPVVARERLEGWFAHRLSDATDVAVSEVEIPASAGLSMTTLLFDAEWTVAGATERHALAARVAPATAGLFKSPDLRREFALVTKLAQSTPVPVAPARWLEEDRSVLGAPFMVSDRVAGRVAPDDPPYTVAGWVLDLPPHARGQLYKRATGILAQIHRVDWRALGLEFLDEPQFGTTGIDQQIGHWEDTYRWAAAGRIASPTIEAALEWAVDAKPTGEDLALNWGDPRIGNILYAEDLTVNGILDWEMATIASPELDLGWYVFIVRYYTEGIGVPQPDGLPSREDLIAEWEQATERTARHIDYYEAFAALRLSILMVRVGRIMVQAGAIPADSPMSISNPASQLLAQLAPVPAPDAEAASFYGKR